MSPRVIPVDETSKSEMSAPADKQPSRGEQALTSEGDGSVRPSVDDENDDAAPSGSDHSDASYSGGESAGRARHVGDGRGRAGGLAAGVGGPGLGAAGAPDDHAGHRRRVVSAATARTMHIEPHRPPTTPLSAAPQRRRLAAIPLIDIKTKNKLRLRGSPRPLPLQQPSRPRKVRHARRAPLDGGLVARRRC